MDQRDPARLLRWFLLIWEILVYLWGMLALCVDPAVLNDAYNGRFCIYVGSHKDSCLFFLSRSHVDPGLVGGFTALMLVHVTALWLGLRGLVPRRLLLPYFLAQAGLVFGISLLAPRATNVALSLCLVLPLIAIGMLRHPRPVAAVAGLSILIFVLDSLWSWGAWSDWGGFWLRFWLKSNYVVLILFAVGYLLLYVQQLRVQDQLRAAAAQLEELTLLTERQRLARELHDTLAQGLAGVLMQLQAANARLANGRYERAGDAIQQAMMDVRAALTESRYAIDDLRVAETEGPALIQAVREAIKHFTTATGIACGADLDALASLAGPRADHVLRAVREGLTNVARHARTGQAWVRAEQREATIVVEIGDAGIGFDPEVSTGQAGHYGLLGLRERARLAGGRLDLVSAPGAGAIIRFSVPRFAEVEAARSAELDTPRRSVAR
jgi:NarL family two-component system sensor histidine kinase YdfH